MGTEHGKMWLTYKIQANKRAENNTLRANPSFYVTRTAHTKGGSKDTA
jgi:hypothetical protein